MPTFMQAPRRKYSLMNSFSGDTIGQMNLIHEDEADGTIEEDQDSLGKRDSLITEDLDENIETIEKRDSKNKHLKVDENDSNHRKGQAAIRCNF